LEALGGDPKRIALVAPDLVAHFEKRVEARDVKSMIVCMSRLICVDLYNALIKLRPDWKAETLKVVMTGAAEDGPEWQKHIGNKEQRRGLANQFEDAKNPFKSGPTLEGISVSAEALSIPFYFRPATLLPTPAGEPRTGSDQAARFVACRARTPRTCASIIES
jgi:hypothetical protein